MGSEILRGVYPERSEGLRMTGLDLAVAEELSSAFEPCLKIHYRPYYDRMIVTVKPVEKSLFLSMKGDSCGDTVFE